MKTISRLLTVLFCILALGRDAIAVELFGTANVNVTSETSADAKNIAMSQARRQILSQVLGKYANAKLVDAAIKNAKNDDLVNMISASSIDDEQLANTAYSANITMYIDVNAASGWLSKNNIPNRLSGDNKTDVEDYINIVVVMSDKLADWSELKSVARATDVIVDTRYIMGQQATIVVQKNKYAAFVNALHSAGWHSDNQNGLLKIWK